MSDVRDHAGAVLDFLRRQRSAPDASLSLSIGNGLAGGGGGDGGGSSRPFSSVAGIVGGNADVIAERGAGESVDDYFANSYVEPFWQVIVGTWTEGAAGITCTGTVAGATPRGVLICAGFDQLVNGDVWGDVASNNAGFLSRWDFNAGTGYFARRPTPTTVALLRRDSPTTGVVLAGPVAYVAGQTFGVRCVGTQIDLLVAGVSVASVADASYAQGWTGIATQADGSTVTEFHALRV